MLSGQGNKNSERTTMGLISKKETLHAQHTFCTFLCCCFNLHDNNVKLPESSLLHVLWRKCHLCSCSLFFHCLSFSPSLVTSGISHFLTATTKFSCCSSNKKCLPCFLSLALSSSLSLFFSLSFAGLSPTFSFSIP